MENDDPNPPTYKACSQCKRLDVPYHDSRKSCEHCRAKARKRFHDKKRALTAQLASLNSTSSIQTQLKMPPPQTAKRKIEETRNTPRKVSKQSVPATATKAVSLQYQKAGSLYEAIKTATLSNSRCNFSGCHSIVYCDTIDHTKRAKMVTRDLLKIVKIPFKYDKPYKYADTDTQVRVKYGCKCALSPPKTLSSTKSTNLQHETVCGGTVAITVRDDGSHPLGIPGQQIVVEIVH
ncbi:hypothetical protein AGABI2DRAFT_195917 [Agaricus bisporus var. bisporus H97]|uniref:hypothetical protein n=1 Tax=Agaricus bisporus var. bisporus (strain H97 / ATCC MYA-4626 / FGSC 10389) TaxID=936046 RepID=UPI00029F5C74|nr:hypothetical protein AGABI2DRAFT_195917 [Agaricus bisporus var. bisporus H97]EKV42127.1 hypothetical protein AGABI2DRAFT_195917 [Agaricus bisporus var. bisporus H97]